MKTLLAIWAASLTVVAQAAVESFDMVKEIATAYEDELIDAEVKLHLGNEPTPEFVEIARPDIYTGTSISLSPFGGSRRHCLDAFQRSLKSLVGTARTRGYDAIVNLRPVQNGKPSDDSSGFKCSPGYKVTTVALSGSFAMSEAASRRQAESEKQSLNLPDRKPAAGAIFLPMEPVLASEEAAAILGAAALSLHWGVQAPGYVYRDGPDDYSEEVDLSSGGVEAACKQAALKVMRSLVDEAKSKNFNSIIKVRSHLNKRYAPLLGDLECQVDKKTVGVTLQATLAQKKVKRRFDPWRLTPRSGPPLTASQPGAMTASCRANI